ncbi:TPA: hypothetical protein O4I50_001222 [Vibrio parahaemolyticus]|nr:hypothetical protein [Vibrio parahaemolyticus]
MSKVFKATCKSFKGQHPAGLVIHEVYVTDKFAKDAVEKAKIELKFWDPEHFDKYQAPKVVAVKENAETELETYLLKKENHGQEEINEQPGEAELPTNTTNLFDEPSATVAEFAIAYPYVVRVAIALSKGSFLSSYSILNSEDNAVAVGFISSFNPRSFKEIDNAISFAIGNAIEAINKHMGNVFIDADLESSIKMLKNYSSDAESEFIDNYVDDIDLQSAIITEVVAEVEKLTTSNKTDEISIIADAVICHRDYKNCADPHEPEEFIGQVKSNFKEISDEYGELPGKSIAEHIQSMSSVRDLYNLGPCEEIAGLYITHQSNELSEAAKDALDKTIATSQENADKDWPKGEPLAYDSSNEWQRLAFTILSKTNEAGEPTPQQYKEIAAKLCGVFAERGLELMSGEFYSEVATQLITNAINADSVISTLFNLRELRKLISEITESPSSNESESKHGLKPNHNTENEHECFIAEILSRLQTDGANFLTSEQFEEAGEKFNIILDEANKTYGNEFDRVSTLENIRNIDWDNISEATKVFLNIRSLRACFRENVEVIKTTETASNEVEKPEVATNEASSGNNEQINGNSEPKQQESLPEEAKQVVEPGNAVPASNDDTVSDNGDGHSVNVRELDIPCIDLDGSNPNMNIWNRAFKTDLAFTKRDTSSGLLSINPQYRGMKATEIFGSEGKGWGVNVIERWIEEGMPIFINGQPIGICESTQHIEIELWYIHPDDGQRYTITSFGETERYYWSHNYSRMIKNTDCYKKSLTDATGKALSKLGICGDVYMGEYDDEHIDTLNHNVKEANKKVRQLEEEEKIRTEVNEQVAEIIEEMQETTTKAGVNTLRAKALHIISGLPDINDEQKRKKSSVIQKLEVRYNERLNEVVAEQERKKQEKAAKAAADKEAAQESTEKQEA